MNGRPQCGPEPLQSVREHPPDRVDGTLPRDPCRSSEPAHGPSDEVEPVAVVMGRTPGGVDGAEGGARDGSARWVDDQRWIEGLSRTGAAHERTCEELHEILFRAARREARQRALYLRVAGPDLDDLACQAASDALLLIIGKVREFRGESQFTTWATRFVVFQVMAKLRQHARRHRSSMFLPQELWEELPAAHPSPDLEAEARDLAGVVMQAVDSHLTARQRTVLLGLVRGATPAALAGELELNANAVHQTMFRARRSLRHHLIAQGYLATTSDSPSRPTVGLAENRKRAS
jgi:RNA polymerase sigma-70 factor, ECF subfamily